MLFRVVFLAFGNSSEIYQQVHAAALSVLAASPDSCEIIVFTNRPHRFSWLSPLIRVEHIDDNELRLWKAGQNHYFRAKFLALKRTAAMGHAHLIYLDSDVLIRHSLNEIVSDLNKNVFFMHAKEKKLGERKTSNRLPLLKKTLGRDFEDITITEETVMFNAGVIAIPANEHHFIEKAFLIHEAMLSQGVNHWLMEQLSWSALLGSTFRLRESKNYILHYWGNKLAFQKAINSFLAEILINGCTPREAAENYSIEKFDLPLRVKKRWWHDPIQKVLHLPL